MKGSPDAYARRTLVCAEKASASPRREDREDVGECFAVEVRRQCDLCVGHADPDAGGRRRPIPRVVHDSHRNQSGSARLSRRQLAAPPRYVCLRDSRAAGDLALALAASSPRFDEAPTIPRLYISDDPAGGSTSRAPPRYAARLAVMGDSQERALPLNATSTSRSSQGAKKSLR